MAQGWLPFANHSWSTRNTISERPPLLAFQNRSEQTAARCKVIYYRTNGELAPQPALDARALARLGVPSAARGDIGAIDFEEVGKQAETALVTAACLDTFARSLLSCASSCAAEEVQEQAEEQIFLAAYAQASEKGQISDDAFVALLLEHMLTEPPPPEKLRDYRLWCDTQKRKMHGESGGEDAEEQDSQPLRAAHIMKVLLGSGFPRRLRGACASRRRRCGMLGLKARVHQMRYFIFDVAY